MATTTEAGTKASDASGRKPRKPRSNKPKTTPSAATRSMTDEHKERIAEGKEQARIVGRYLEGLAATRPKRGRKVTPETLQAKLDKIEADLADASPLDRLNLIQERKNVQAQLEVKDSEIDMDALEKDFVRVGKVYAERKHIARSTFTEVGVPVEVLKAAGI